MATSKIKVGDNVRVIAGKDKHKEGKVIAIDHKKGKLMVEGIHMVTKNTKPSANNRDGGQIKKEAFFDASNVMYIHKGKTTRIGFKMDGDKKVRFAKSTGDIID